MKRGFLSTLSFFFKLYPRRTLIVVGLLILSGFAEAIGVASFLPLLQIILEGKDGALPPGPVADTLTGFGIPANFMAVSALIVAGMTGKAAFLWAAMRYVSLTVSKVSGDLRMRFMHALTRADWRYFVSHTLGTSLNAIATETFSASTAFVSATRFMAACIQFMIYAGGALLVSWVMFVGGVVIGGLIVASLWFLVRVARRAGQAQAYTARVMLEQLADMIQGIKPLRAMALEDKFLGMMQSHSEDLQQAQADQLTSSQSMRIFNEPLMMLAGVASLYLAVTYGALESSALILMGVFFMRMLTTMNAAQNEYQRLVTQEGALSSLMETIHKAEAAHQNWPGTGHLSDDADTISLHNVSFSYTAERPLLSDISLVLPSRRFTALIGQSGSGKTSILDLICGFYTPSAGTIEVSGRDISKLDLTAWRKSIGFVPQEVFLFNDSVYENVSIGRNVTEQDVWAALDAAGAKEFVEAMDSGINANVGENGRKLSGGQRQRIAIARALVGRPRFLLLDEATSALDHATEEHLLKTLKDLSQSVSVIFVSHNRAVQNYADVVYELSQGRLVQKAA